MRAVVMHATGDPDVLGLEPAARPEPGPDDVLIRVRAAGINPIDWKYRRGLVERELPAVLGEDVSGTVEVSCVDGFAQGDPVYGVARSGGYADFAVASGTAVAIKPAGLSHEQAAALPVSGMTAWQGLFGPRPLEPGQTVLVAGASGGIGHLAVQLARHAGAYVIGTGSPRSRGFVLGLGADQFIDYTSGDVADLAGSVDLALDTVGGPTTCTLVPAVRRGGVLVTLAYPPEAVPRAPEIHVEPVIMKPSSDRLARLGELAASGDIRVEVAETLPLSGVERAHKLSESRHVRGKLVMSVSP